MEDILRNESDLVKSNELIRKVASPHVHFASQICTNQGNLTLLLRKFTNFVSKFLHNKKII